MNSDWTTMAAAASPDGGSALPAGVVKSAALLLGLAAALALVLRVLWSLKRLTSPAALPESDGGGSHPPPADGQSGHAITEFALVFPFALMLVLLVVQVALILQANLVVNHAAFCAARSAVVWIPRGVGGDGPNEILHDNVDDSQKFLRMQLAAARACWPIAGTFSQDFAARLAAGRPWTVPVVSTACAEMRLLPGAGRVFGVYSEQDFLNKYLYSVVSTRIMYQSVVPMSAIPPEHGRFGPDMFVRVGVEHDFALRIPYAGRILGVRQTAVGRFRETVPDEDHLYVLTLSANAMLSNEGRQEYPPGINGR